MIVDDDDGNTISFRGGVVYVNGKPELNASRRIIVAIDIPSTAASTLDAAYAQVYDLLSRGTRGTSIEWESTDEWYGIDGEPIDEDTVARVRMAYLESLDAQETAHELIVILGDDPVRLRTALGELCADLPKFHGLGDGVHPSKLQLPPKGAFWTMNASLLDMIPLESVESVQQTLRLLDSAGRVRLLIDDEARRVWVAYRTRVQTVSEILRSEGLW